MSNKRKQAFTAILGGLALGSAAAQTHVVKSPDTVVRAVGVYEWTGTESKPTASRFVPITLFINGQLEDADVYLARPVPFALQTGTIFELERSGVPQGTLELSFARHLVSTGDIPIDDGWLGFGAFKPLSRPTEIASNLRPGRVSQIEVSGGKSRPSFGNQPASAKPAATPSTSTTTDNSTDPDRPTLNRKTGNPSESSTGSTSTAAPTTTTSTASTQDSGADPDRPTMKRRTDSDSSAPSATQTAGAAPTPTPAADPDRPTMKRPSTDANSTSASTTAPAAVDDGRAPEVDPDRPTLRKRTEAQRQAARREHDSSSVSGGTASLNDDPDRPSLHRGKAPGALDEGDLPALQGLPAGVHQQIGVSDAANRPEHDFKRAWEDEAEHAAVLSKMQGLARTALLNSPSSLAVPAPSPSAVKPVQRTTSVAQRKAAAARAKVAAARPAPGAVLTDEDMRGYTLSYGGAATFVYSATSAGPNGTSRYVNLVAQREPAGELKVAMLNVTDSAHLDTTPRFQLVDAVDAEASNRAALLFQLRAQSSRQFALYRVIGAEAQQLFVTGSTQ